MSGQVRAAQLASIRLKSGQVSRGSAGEYCSSKVLSEEGSYHCDFNFMVRKSSTKGVKGLAYIHKHKKLSLLILFPCSLEVWLK